jgi:hypothetical protein
MYLLGCTFFFGDGFDAATIEALTASIMSSGALYLQNFSRNVTHFIIRNPQLTEKHVFLTEQ